MNILIINMLKNHFLSKDWKGNNRKIHTSHLSDSGIVTNQIVLESALGENYLPIGVICLV